MQTFKKYQQKRMILSQNKYRYNKPYVYFISHVHLWYTISIYSFMPDIWGLRYKYLRYLHGWINKTCANDKIDHSVVIWRAIRLFKALFKVSTEKTSKLDMKYPFRGESNGLDQLPEIWKALLCNADIIGERASSFTTMGFDWSHQASTVDCKCMDIEMGWTADCCNDVIDIHDHWVNINVCVYDSHSSLLHVCVKRNWCNGFMDTLMYHILITTTSINIKRDLLDMPPNTRKYFLPIANYNKWKYKNPPNRFSVVLKWVLIKRI